MSDLYQSSLADIRARLQRKEVSAEAVTVACLERIEATEKKLGALISVCADKALEDARALDAQGPDPRNALWGVPVTVKDALSTESLRTTAGSRMLENYTPFYDAFAVSRLKEAGAVILGKNNMDEFAMGSSTENSAYQCTHNPWNLGCVPGGSSGGSAASVVSGQCFASLGSDTGGSIRQPAALCGCVGLKPTYGRVSRYGLIAYGSSLDQVGPLARSVEDCALVYAAIAGHDPRDSTSANLPDVDADTCLMALHVPGAQPLQGVRIGIPKEYWAEGLDAEGDEEVVIACRAALENAQKLGATLVDVSLPLVEQSIAAYYIIAMAEASANLARFDGVRYGHRTKNVETIVDLYAKSRTEGFGEEVRRRIMLGTYVLSSGYYDAYYRKAAQVRRCIRDGFEQALEQCDVLCAPVSPVTAWPLGARTADPVQMYLMDVYTLALNLAGLPGLSLPVGLGEKSKMPVGIQLLGRAFDENRLLQVGHALESLLPPLGIPKL